VRANGQSGYIVSLFLALADGSSAPTAPEETPDENVSAPAEDAATPGEITGIAYIAGTNNDGVRCRTDASTSAPVIAVVPEGTRVELIGNQTNGWQPVNCNGRAGFVSAQYVSASAPSQAPSDDTSDSGEATTGGTDEITGSGTIYNTNGDGIRCRAGAGYDKNVITVLTEGQKVDLRGTSATDWQPVFCAGRKGFIHKDFVQVGGSATTSQTGSTSEASFSAAATGTATVSGTNGGGLRCRSSASYSGSVITVLAEGTKVSLRGSVQGEWQPVTCASRNGFVHKDYLSSGGSSSSGGGTSSGGTSSGIYDSIVGTAKVRTDDGSGLNCRAGAGYNYRVVTTFANGSTIDIRGRGYGDWTPVVCAGRNGYVLKIYVDFGGGSTAGNDGGASSGLAAGDNAKVTGTNGTGVRFRSGPSTSASVISVLAENTVVKVRTGSTGSWVAVTYNGSNGFVHKDYLSETTQAPSNPGSGTNDGGNSGSGTGYRLANGDHARTTSSLNLRYSPSFTGGVAAVAPSGTVVLITGTPSSGFYPVNWDGLKGYMHTDYLSKTTAALSDRGGSGNTDSGNTDDDSGGGGGGDATGSAIVNYARQYLGYPYVWATHGPGSFDCSGFTYWVILNTLGKNIGAGLWTQVAAGTPVSRSNLQPGDLVFFQNTYTWGLSHVGIYIGGDQFIHAENASTGVKISNLSSQYYSSRWYGAVRIR
jgi:N-acetylmuramoyl-L-alanine amidase